MGGKERSHSSASAATASSSPSRIASATPSNTSSAPPPFAGAGVVACAAGEADAAVRPAACGRVPAPGGLGGRGLGGLGGLGALLRGNQLRPILVVPGNVRIVVSIVVIVVASFGACAWWCP